MSSSPDEDAGKTAEDINLMHDVHKHPRHRWFARGCQDTAARAVAGRTAKSNDQMRYIDGVIAIVGRFRRAPTKLRPGACRAMIPLDPGFERPKTQAAVPLTPGSRDGARHGAGARHAEPRWASTVGSERAGSYGNHNDARIAHRTWCSGSGHERECRSAPAPRITTATYEAETIREGNLTYLRAALRHV
jgi:hypothetical protein